MKTFRLASTLALNNISINREQSLSIIAADFNQLMFESNRIRNRHHGNEVSVCSIVNARSGKCSENCKFCAQSVHNSAKIDSFDMISPDKIVAAFNSADKFPISHFGIVTSGRNEAGGKKIEKEKLIDALKKMDGDAAASLCVSIGGIDDEFLKILKEYGVTRIHHNLETSENFFPKICTSHSYQERIENIKRAKKYGFNVCSGGLFGLGESWEDRIDLALQLQQLEIKSVPLNFLNPVEGTPLENAEPILPRDILRIIALFRFVLPTAEIKIAGGREVNLRDMQSWIFAAGATSLMIGDYLTTKGRGAKQDLQMIKDLGLRVAR
ncbi:MAG: biotin synthase BioB [Chlamydiae bacterium]|nr:MAG: biotin synthase BioB [Chlamydiota bacterium]